MRDSFKKSVDFLINIEGGYVNNPRDPGGETKYGISARSYPKVDIKNLTPEKAADIYLKDFWIKAGCDDLPWPLDWVVFDTSVHSGVIRSKKYLKITNNWQDYLKLRLILFDQIIKKNPEMKYALQGWKNRIAKVKKFAETSIDI